MKKILYRNALLISMLYGSAVEAGTIGISGAWSFTETEPYVQYDSSGMPMYAESFSTLTGQFNFDAGTVNFDPVTLLGNNMYIEGNIVDNLNGTYTGNLNFSWSLNTYSGSILWDITDNGDNTATVLTLDGDGDGIPGNQFLEGPFYNTDFGNFSPVINGQLTSVVPIPAAVWLFSSGLIGLFFVVRKKKS